MDNLDTPVNTNKTPFSITALIAIGVLLITTVLIIYSIYHYWKQYSPQVISNQSEMVNISQWRTDKGIKVLFVPSHELPIVDIRLMFRAGSAYDNNKPGQAMLTGALLNQGTTDHNADEIANTFDDVGAQLSHTVTRDASTLILRSLKEPALFAKALAMVREIVQHSSFPQDAFAREKKRLLRTIQYQQQQPGQIVKDAFFKALYQAHPYASPLLGTQASVTNLKRDDVDAFFKRYYVAQNASMAIVGDLSTKDAQKLAQSISEALSDGKQAPVIPAPKAATASTQTIAFPSSQVHIRMGLIGIARNDPDYYPLYLANHILGGSALTSLLFTEIREKRGLAYSVYSYFQLLKEKGPFVIGLQTRADQATESLQVVKNTLQDFLKKGPSEEQLKEAKQYISGSFPLRLDSNQAIVNYLAVIAFYDLPLNYLDTFVDNIEAVSAAQVKAAFARHVKPKKMVTITVGSAKKPPAQAHT